MIHKDYCSHCKIKDIPLIRCSTNKTNTIQYYICRICQRERTKKYYHTTAGRISFRKKNVKTWGKYPEKQQARIKVQYAIRSGKLRKSSICEICCKPGRIEGHHMDYSKPMKVVWLCTHCHATFHNV